MASLADDSFDVVALDPDTWNLFEDLAGRHNGVFGGCWCIYFHPDGPERGQGAEANREYGTPEELPTIHHRKQRTG